MGILKFFKGKNDQEISFIKENGLENWWEQSFSDREKKKIISESSNLLSNPNPNRTAARTLYLLAGNVVTKFHNNNPEVIIRLLKKAAELSEEAEERFEIYSQLVKLLQDEERKEEALSLIRQAEEKNWKGSWEELKNEIN